mgnify:CR=1 FL=1|tara:strand:- start:11794 stop:12597 length:804 start_codon:yes stop_codon:yes gene_type:complete
MKWKDYLEENIDPDDVDIKNVAVKDNLDPVIWDDRLNLKNYLAEHLYKIAKDFFKTLDLDWNLVEDVTLTGSLANYNWSKYSDVDLHLIVDYAEVDENEKLVKDFFRNASAMWNRTHKITVKGHDVELYVQDSKEPHHSTGVYSIKYDRWNNTPTKYDPQIDKESLKKKSAKWMNDIDEVYELLAVKDYKTANEQSERLMKKLKKYRQGGLEKGGEHSIENLVFKVLRRNDYLQRLSNLRIVSYDNMMTVNGGIGSEIIKISLNETN